MNTNAANTAPPHDFDLTGRVAIVTGGASGIGQAIAVAIARHGGVIAVVDLPAADTSATLAAIRAAGTDAISIGADVTSPEQMNAAVAQVQAELGPLTLAVNAAGIADAAPAEEMSLSQWQRVYDVDVTGVFVSCQAEARAMLTHGGGSIVNIASMSGTIANRGLLQSHYNSAKAAVIHLSASLAMEWAQHGLRVNSVSPGYTATPMNTRPEMVDQMQVFADETPMARIADPAEIGGPSVFLLSDASSFVTGIDLLVDGGFCAR